MSQLMDAQSERFGVQVIDACYCSSLSVPKYLAELLAYLNQQMDKQFTKHLSTDEKQQLMVLLKEILELD